jgi:uncharacterized protein
LYVQCGIEFVQFEWDEAKNESNRRKHGVGFDEARLIFDGPTLTRIDSRENYGEVREISVGAIQGIVVLVVTHTDRQGRTRLISARHATRQERKLYYGYLG